MIYERNSNLKRDRKDVVSAIIDVSDLAQYLDRNTDDVRFLSHSDAVMCYDTLATVEEMLQDVQRIIARSKK